MSVSVSVIKKVMGAATRQREEMRLIFQHKTLTPPGIYINTDFKFKIFHKLAAGYVSFIFQSLLHLILFNGYTYISCLTVFVHIVYNSFFQHS